MLTSAEDFTLKQFVVLIKVLLLELASLTFFCTV